MHCTDESRIGTAAVTPTRKLRELGKDFGSAEKSEVLFQKKHYLLNNYVCTSFMEDNNYNPNFGLVEQGELEISYPVYYQPLTPYLTLLQVRGKKKKRYTAH
jgi:hypothetical protein